MIYTKRLSKLILLLIITLSVCFLGLFCFNIVYITQPKNNIKPSAAFSGGSGTSSDPYLIKTLADIKSLAETVDGGDTCAGKHFKLSNDIEYSHASYDAGDLQIGNEWDWDAFCGVFDGNGHYLSNLGGGEGNYNFCGYLGSGGVIKNLGFTNNHFAVNEDNPWTGIELSVWPFATIVGYVGEGATIQSCVVSNTKFSSNKFSHAAQVGCIAYTNYGTIKNCVVEGTITLRAINGNGLLNDDGLDFYYFVKENYGTLKHNVFTASISEVHGDDGSLSDFIYVHNENQGTIYTSYSALPYNNIESSTVCGNHSVSNTDWFKYEYSHYEPRLRAFMSWTSYIFKVNKTKGGTVDDTYVTVPSEYSKASINNNTRQVTILYKGITVTATAKSGSGYKFDNWSKFLNIYTANFVPIEYTISYDYAGGNATNKTNYTIETATFTLNNPTKTGYEFTGWSGTGLTGENNMTVTISEGSTGNRNYTAHWKVKTYGIDFVNNYTSFMTMEKVGDSSAIEHGSYIKREISIDKCIYKIYNSNKTTVICTVTYTLNNEAQYYFTEADAEWQVTKSETICPTVATRQFTVDFASVDGTHATKEGRDSITVDYGTRLEIGFNYDSTTHIYTQTYAIGGETITYTANGKYVYNDIDIRVINPNPGKYGVVDTYNISLGVDTNLTITEGITITPSFEHKKFKIIFGDTAIASTKDTTGNNGNDYVTITYESTVEVEYNNETNEVIYTITDTINNTTTQIKYKPEDKYMLDKGLENGANEITIKDDGSIPITVGSDPTILEYTITPTFKLKIYGGDYS